MKKTSRRALVLAGGSFAASSWEIGVLAGMASEGLDLRDSDLFIGTSAGARVALYLASGKDLEEGYQQQFAPVQNPHPTPSIDFQSLRKETAEAKAAGGSHEAILKRFGAIAMKYGSLEPADLEARRQTMAAQLPVQTWPAKPVQIVALNAETGARRVFDSASGVSLVDAMIATTGAFGAPPALIQGHYYIDGGYHSSNNADLAVGFDEVIVLSLRAPPGALALIPLEETVAAMRAAKINVTAIRPDKDSEEAAMAGSPGNPAVRGPTAKAGYAQGKRLAKEGPAA